MIKSNFYRITTALSVLLLAAATVFVLIRWSQIPDQIPIHYNFSGEANSYGGKGSLILMMVVGWVTFISVCLTVKRPHLWNLPVKITAENRNRVYGIARAMMEALKVLITLLFVHMLVSIALDIPLSGIITMIIVIALLLVVIVSILLMYKNK